MLARRGQDPANEAEITRAAHALLDKAERGPGRDEPTKKDRKIVGRARAVSAAERPQPASQPPPPAWDDAEEEDGDQLAQVIPLGIFDAHEEAKKWW
jgi:hypothetical protein